MNEELKKYIESEIALGISRADIRTVLTGQAGWIDEDVDRVFASIDAENRASSTSIPSTPATPTPTVASVGQTQNLSTPHAHSFSVKPIILVGIIVCVLVAGGAAFAYFGGLSLFAGGAPYSKDNLVSGIADSIGKMDTFRFSAEGAFEVEERDSDAVPFVPPPERVELVEKYKRDYERILNAETILGRLYYDSDYASLAELEAMFMSNPWYEDRGINFSDPLTSVPFGFTNNDDGYSLTITFETDEAIKAIQEEVQGNREYGFLNISEEEDTTVINENTREVTFTQTSPTWFFFSPNYPKSFIEEWGDMMEYMPPELYFGVGIKAASDFSEEPVDWEFSLDIEGDMGDLIYRVAGDALKKDDDYYYRIRNIPSIFAQMFTYEKGEWVRISSDWLEDSGLYRNLPSTIEAVTNEENEAEARQAREELVSFIATAIEIADEEEVLQVKSGPKKEERNGEKVYRYDLTFNQTGYIAFIERISAEARKYETTEDFDLTKDAEFMDYIQSDEFEFVFNYLNDNTTLTMWVDGAGLIHGIEYSFRIVPPDDVEMLSDKQARLTVTLGFDDINKQIKIDAPDEYQEIEDVLEKMGLGSLGGSRVNGMNAAVKASMNNLRAISELYYDDNNSSYSGVCSSEEVEEVITRIQDTIDDDEIVVTCQDSAGWYVISTPLVSTDDTEEYYCVDWKGTAKVTTSELGLSAQSCS